MDLHGYEEMTNNDILRRLKYIFRWEVPEIKELFESAEYPVDEEQIQSWLKREDEPDFLGCSDADLSMFLNGFINVRRGKKEGPQPGPVAFLTNNIIFMKLKIALNLQADKVLELLAMGKLELSKHELSAYFRKPENKRYRECPGLVLDCLFQGLRMVYRDDVPLKTK